MQYLVMSRKVNKNLVKKIKNSGIKIYAFHLNKRFDEKYMICKESDYFHGIYEDNIDFKSLINYNN